MGRKLTSPSQAHTCCFLHQYGTYAESPSLSLPFPPAQTIIGTLPPAFLNGFNSSHAKGINLSANMLTGTLPPDWGANYSTVLERLDLSRNYFNGTIPSSWSRLALNASHFSLASNYLNGSVPASFSSFAPPAGYK